MAVQTFARGLVIVTIFFGTIAVCVLMQVVFGQTNGGTTAMAAIAALGGLLCAQGVAQTRHAGARALLGFGGLLGMSLLLGVPMPPATVTARVNVAVLVTAIAMSGVAGLLAARRPRIARGLVAVLSLYGAAILISTIRLSVGQAHHDGPGVTLSRSFAILLGANWLVASWSLMPRRAPVPKSESVAAAT